MKPTEIIGNCSLWLGDCREILPMLAPVDLILTDPPYGIGADKVKAHSSIRDNDAWENRDWDNATPPAWLFGLMREKAGTLMVWGGNYFADMLPASSGWLCWRKPQAETGFSLADIELCWTSLDFAARTKTLPRRNGRRRRAPVRPPPGRCLRQKIRGAGRGACPSGQAGARRSSPVRPR